MSNIETRLSKFTANLLWDIDGTLLNTNGIGLKYLSDATCEFTGVELENCHDNNHGLTDFEIVMRCLSNVEFSDAIKIEVVNKVIESYIERYEQAPNITSIQSYPIFNSEFFETLVSHGIGNYILTGNCYKGALLKLRQTNLDRFFDLENSFFSNKNEWRREKIMEKALASLDIKKTLVIGDTFRDYSLAKFFGMKSVLLNWKRDSALDTLLDRERLTVFREEQILAGNLLRFLIDYATKLKSTPN